MKKAALNQWCHSASKNPPIGKQFWQVTVKKGLARDRDKKPATPPCGLKYSRIQLIYFGQGWEFPLSLLARLKRAMGANCSCRSFLKSNGSDLLLSLFTKEQKSQ